ncbi:MAG: hypothetical protein IPP19_16975 [Verrucomicrobia bacterium]|nr:hypothetical protein [Verrucomicrobiota bacterium]
MIAARADDHELGCQKQVACQLPQFCNFPEILLSNKDRRAGAKTPPHPKKTSQYQPGKNLNSAIEFELQRSEETKLSGLHRVISESRILAPSETAKPAKCLDVSFRGISKAAFRLKPADTLYPKY